MKEPADASICVVDRGLFLPFAQVLARHFKQVFYYVSNDSPFPTPHLSVLGDGFESVERVRELWGLPVDGYVFPDVGHAALQAELRRQGFPVWGSGDASDLELKRLAFKRKQGQLGMKVPPYETAIGLPELKKRLADKEEAYIKISTYRGLMETYHHHDPEKTNLWADHLSTLLGPLQKEMLFIIEDPIEAIVETGLDTYCVAGEFPQVVVQGIEAKDKGYAGTVTPWNEMPQHLTDLATKLKPELGEYANFLSLEVRITDKDEAFLTDPSCRHATPAGECLLELISNIGDVVWAGANSELVEPVYSEQFAMQALVDHPEDETGWRSAKIDPAVQRWFKPYSACQIEGTIYWPPLPWSCETVGSVVAIGDSLKTCLEHLKKSTEILEAAGLEVHLTSLAEVLKSIEEEEQAGVPFTDQPLPEPTETLP